MKSKVFIVLAVLAVAFMAVPAMADYQFTSDLNIVGSHDYGFPTDITSYGTVGVNLLSPTHATVNITLTSNPDFDFVWSFFNDYAAFLNVAGDINYGASSISNGWTLDGQSNPTGDGFGHFDVTGYRGVFGSVESVNFNLYAASGTTWADAASVLVCNELGYDAAVYIVADYVNFNPSGYVGEACNPIPIPPSALLMGSGLLGLVGLGWRRKRS